MRTKKTAFNWSVVILLFLMTNITFQACDPDEDKDDDGDDEEMAYKPNIYIYPTKTIDLSVKIGFPLGGKVVTSIPTYGDGWNVSVDTNGLINSHYTFLFYESKQPDIWQHQSGWLVKNNELESFFRGNMEAYGFKGHEIEDYIDYWIPRLKEYPFYAIMPQTKIVIDEVITLSFSIHPERLLRLFYVIKGEASSNNSLIEPNIKSFSREGYFITEWGVILK